MRHGLIGVCAAVVAMGGASAAIASDATTGSVIFLHPDGTGMSAWHAARLLLVGPDGDLEWDRLPSVGVYRDHVADKLTPSSNAGGTIHATGVKTDLDSFGMTAGGSHGRPLVDAAGERLSVAAQAMRAGIPVGLVQTGHTAEPGTACFVAEAPSRGDFDSIVAQLVESDLTVCLGGGEDRFLPKGVRGMYGEGRREDGRNLLEEARSMGWTVVQTREELLALPEGTARVLGVFAAGHTFNDRTEERLAETELDFYQAGAPTYAEMTAAAIRVLSARSEQFLLIAEEEGTDNFGNVNNASGMLEALRRADEAVGVARAHLAEHPRTLVLVAADSDAGGMHALGIMPGSDAELPRVLPPRAGNGSPVDGTGGTGTAPFLAQADRAGKRMQFAIVWSSGDDLGGGVVARADGLNAEMVRGSFDNTDVARVIRKTLFGE
jgi:alkaline phosphatase